MSYDPVIPLLGIYPGKTKTVIWRYSHPMFIATLFVVDKTWKHLNENKTFLFFVFSNIKWDLKLLYIYTMEYYWAFSSVQFSCSVVSYWATETNYNKQEQIWVSCSQVDEPRAYYTEWSKSEREKWILYINTYVCELEKMILMNLFAGQR